ncbi:MAG: ADP-glyceromanno-heptose 6-epimerase [Alphaproteobacteria bacterium]|nr:ADP-glyceromanno-heptose 6-epimerase [Alphaproteobacteria bacterium]
MIIVTGSTGFIGSNVLAALEAKGYKDLVVVDWLGVKDKWKNIAKRELAAVLPPEQLPEFLKQHEKEITAVIHMGAISTTTEKDVDLIVERNIQSTWDLWCFCRDFQKQFIYASSAATYGSGENGFEDRDDLDYLNSLRPLNPYGWSKAFIDRKIAREVAENRKTPKQYAGLKLFNVYGPNEYHKGEQESVVAHIFPSVRNNEEVKLFKSYHTDYKDGQQLRDFVWVGDVVRVIIWLLENPEVSGLFNVGSGSARSFYDLAKAAWDAMGLPPKIGYKKMPPELQDKYQYYTKASLDKLRKAGFTEPMTSLEDGVRLYVTEFLNKEDRYL